MMMERLVHEREYSDDTAKLIDQEVEALITEAGNRARAVIKANKKPIEKLKDLLLDKETVEASEVLGVFQDTVLPDAAKLY
jgi:cell division protease FtsH